MKTKLLFCAVAVLLSATNLLADNTSTKRYLTLTDDEFVINRWWNNTNSNTVSADGTQLYIYGQPGGIEGVEEYYGGQSGWNFAEPIATSDWDRLVVKLKNAGPAVLQFRITDGQNEASHDFAVDADNVATYVFDLSSIYANNDATGTQITSITSVYFWGYWGGGNTVAIDEIYFEKDAAAEPTDPVVVEDTKEIGISSLTQGEYSISGATDYKYLVVVPAKPYAEGGQEYWYNITDGTNNLAGWGFAYGAFQQRRAAVLNITDKAIYDDFNETTAQTSDFVSALASSSIDLTKLTSLHISKGWSTDVVKELEISAVYFSNEKPSYDNRWNFPISSYDFMRQSTAADTWGTVCLPYNAAVCGAYTYEVTGVDNAQKPTKLYLQQTYGLLKAGVAYVFKTNSDRLGDLEEGNVTFYKAGASTVDSPAEGNALVGTFSDETDVPSGKYILTDDGWKTNSTSVTNKINANRAYLDLSKVGVVPADVAAKCITLDIEGSTTGITTVSHTESTSDAIYNLNGVRVQNPAKGIYIQNGKKYIVK